MSIGIILLIILAVPIIFQVVKLAIDQKNRHEEILYRLNRVEEVLNNK
jgi:hypothetical protein